MMLANNVETETTSQNTLVPDRKPSRRKNTVIDPSFIFQHHTHALLQCHSLLRITSTDKKGVKQVSYTPYIQALGQYYILLHQQDSHAIYMVKHGKVDMSLVDFQQDLQMQSVKEGQQYTTEKISQNDERHAYILRLFYEKLSEVIRYQTSNHQYSLFKLT